MIKLHIQSLKLSEKNQIHCLPAMTWLCLIYETVELMHNVVSMLILLCPFVTTAVATTIIAITHINIWLSTRYNSSTYVNIFLAIQEMLGYMFRQDVS